MKRKLTDLMTGSLASTGNRSVTEEKVYQKEVFRLENVIKVLEEEASIIETTKKNTLHDFEHVKGFFERLPVYFKSYDYVRKKKLSKILFSNITATP